jgi:hypothetical protein
MDVLDLSCYAIGCLADLPELCTEDEREPKIRVRIAQQYAIAIIRLNDLLLEIFTREFI